MKTRKYWADDRSRLDDDQQDLDDATAVIAALSGCDDDNVPTSQASGSLRGVWVRSNDDAILRRFRRTR